MAFRYLASTVVQLVCSFAALRRAGASSSQAQGSIVVFKHFHKSAGTAMCHMVKRKSKSGHTSLSLKGLAFNCNLPLEETPLACHFGFQGWSAEKDCARCSAFLQKRRWEFIGTEFNPPLLFGVGPATLCRESFQYVTILRNPISRILSHMAMYSISLQQASNASQQWIGPIYNRTTSKKDVRPVEEGFFRSTPWFNNIYVRELSGVEAYSPQALLKSHLDAAKNTLQQFSAVLLLENIIEDAAQLCFLGWGHLHFKSINTYEERKRKGKRHVDKIPESELSSYPEFNVLVAANALDRDLYKFAQAVSKERRAQAKASFPDCAERSER